ncbi:helix-turn-helix domain-containing protein [Streptomyces sp. NPDC020983]|uniref:helix-turn-helix domain-containing protein n=1 Tax=Streptomyces sp. NPDC020983 TaxID=3365106 RepID=UPI0037A0F7BF
MAEDAEGVRTVREVADVETLKALSDPLRLAILRAMMTDVHGAFRVKELAGMLGQPVTRLYRHIKVLEAAGLIRVARTRLVSGIQESQYQVAQFALRLSRELLAAPGNAGEVADAFAAALNDVRDRLVRDVTTGRFQRDPAPDGSPDPLGPVIVALDTRLSPDRAADFRARLTALVAEFNGPEDEDAGAVPVEFLLMFWSPRGEVPPAAG